MNKYNTKIGQLLALVPRPQFEKCVKETQSDKFCKGFSTWKQFVILAYAQIANPKGLHSTRTGRPCIILEFRRM